MIITLTPTSIENVRPALDTHVRGLVSPIDSFLEEHIFMSAYYHIRLADEVIGWTAIHRDSLITQFALAHAYRHYGQRIFHMVRKLDQVQAAFVPTCDEFFLAHALDDYRRLEKQAYFFQPRPDTPRVSVPPSFTTRFADPSDIPAITAHSGDFFDRMAERIAAEQIHVVQRDGTTVGYGIIEKGVLDQRFASVGMFVREDERRTGVGTSIIRLMMDECLRHGLKPIAGCWYYNHRSKRTLEKAGLFSQTRLLRVEL